MLEWLKNLFKNPKGLIKLAIDSLDYAEPYLTSEIENLKGKPFNSLTSREQATMVIDKIQEFLRDRFHV